MSIPAGDGSAGFLEDYSSEEEKDPGHRGPRQVFSDVGDSDSDSVTGAPLREPSRQSPGHHYWDHSRSAQSTASSTRQASRSHARWHPSRNMISFGTTESLSTIEGSGHGVEDMASAYQELQLINDKLKKEFKLLHEKDQLLKEKEHVLLAREEAISTDKADFASLVEDEVKRRLTQREQEHQLTLQRHDLLLKEKTREHKRLKDNFDTLKATNDTLRKELDNITKEYSKLERQTVSLQGRLINLQRHREQAEIKEANLLPSDLVKKSLKCVKEKPAAQSAPKVASVNLYEVLGVLLGWVAELSVHQTVTEPPTKSQTETHNPGCRQENYSKVLPALRELLWELPVGHPSLVLPCLHFIYWVVIHSEHSSLHQKTSLTSTLRRLGGELYKPRTLKLTEEDKITQQGKSLAKPEKNKDGLYFRSSNLHIRFVSSLIILQTITQVDHVAHVFEMLKCDLKTVEGKELFLQYQATSLLLPYLRPSYKAFQSMALDVYLHLTMESPMLDQFLLSCSNDTWFRAISTLFRTPTLQEKLLEKISIILQKLSKIRSNKRLFDLFGVTTACQGMLRICGGDNGFMALNLKSILFNLSSRASGPSTDSSLSQGSLHLQPPGGLLS